MCQNCNCWSILMFWDTNNNWVVSVHVFSIHTRINMIEQICYEEWFILNSFRMYHFVVRDELKRITFQHKCLINRYALINLSVYIYTTGIFFYTKRQNISKIFGKYFFLNCKILQNKNFNVCATLTRSPWGVLMMWSPLCLF